MYRMASKKNMFYALVGGGGLLILLAFLISRKKENLWLPGKFQTCPVGFKYVETRYDTHYNRDGVPDGTLDPTTNCDPFTCGSGETMDANGCCVEKKAPCTPSPPKKDKNGNVMKLKSACNPPVIFGCPARRYSGGGVTVKG